MSGRGKLSEERGRGITVNWVDRGSFIKEDIKLEFNLKERIRGKLGEGEHNLTLQNGKEQKTKSPKSE